MAAPLFFANADVFVQAVKQSVGTTPVGSVRYLVIDLHAVTDADVQQQNPSTCMALSESS